MKTTAVGPLKCEFAEEGVLWIDKIATGVGIILYNPQHKFAAGVHVLRGLSRGQRVDQPGYFADTAMEYVIQEFSRRDIPPRCSPARNRTRSHPPWYTRSEGSWRTGNWM
jgi:chemotaxis receptor (MCP) glutamine deamidase CheD